MKKNKTNSFNVFNNHKKIGYYLPLIFIISIIPLITHGKIINLTTEEANFWVGGKTYIDFFNYYKSIFLVAATLALLMVYCGLYMDKKLPIQDEKRYYFPILIYLFTALGSALMSESKYVSLVGFVDMYQGIFVVFSYMILLFILINYVNSEQDIKIITNSFLALVVVEGILGLGQYFGFDFFQTPLGKWLISPKSLDSESLNFKFGKYTIYGTLFNTNFVGSFGALVLPLTTMLYLFEKDKKKSLILGIVALLAFSTWLGCNSRAGYLGVFSAFIIGIIICRKIIKKDWRKVILLLTAFIAIVFIFNTVSGGRVINQFSRLNPVKEKEETQNTSTGQQVRFDEVSIKDNSFIIRTNRETLIGSMAESHLNFLDENGNKLGVKVNEEGIITFIDEKYSAYKFTMDEDQPQYIKAEIYGRRWNLYITKDQEFNVISFNKKLTYPVEAPRIKWFDGRETLATNRGYIWSRTIPMLKDTLIIGYGPDNFPMVFPQEDYVGRFNVGNEGMLNIVIDKPHNMYLQTAVNTGVISLLALLAIWGIYIFDSLKIYLKGNMETFAEYMGAATFLSITAYLVAGLFNDSIVSVAPLFWILLGMGIGINKMIKVVPDNK